MWDMAWNAMTLFFQGRLFADPSRAAAQLALGVVVTASLLIVLAKVGVALWLAALI